MSEDDVRDAIRNRSKVVRLASRQPALRVATGPFDPAALPPRPWIVPGFLMRGAVTLLTGPGAAGKSSLVMAWAVALASGRELGGFRPRAPGRVLILNAEDDHAEQRRRLAAAAMAQGARLAEVAGSIAFLEPIETGLLFAVDAERGAILETQAWRDLDRLAHEHEPDVIALDPMAELHSAPENENIAARAVVARLRALAKRSGAAVLLVHHSRKAALAGDQDGARGASAIASAARLHLTATPMTAEEAAGFGLPEAHRRAFLRLDTGKSNHAPGWDADWWELHPREIGNGDAVAAVVPWTPPPEARADDDAALARALRAVREGFGGEPLSEGSRSPAFYLPAFEAAGIPRKAAPQLLRLLRSNREVRLRGWRGADRKRHARLFAEGTTLGGWFDDDH